MSAAKLSPKDGAKMFATGLEPKLAALGFLPVPRVKHTWARTTAAGVVHQVSLGLNAREASPEIALGHPKALAWVAAATGEKKEPWPSTGLEYLYFRGWIPGEPWRDDKPGTFEFGIREESTMARSVRGFMTSLETYALPFFDEHPDAAAVADFFLRKDTYSTPRLNWELTRERRGGPAERFVRTDRALLFVVASCALADRKHLGPQLKTARKLEAQWAKQETFYWSPRIAEWLDALESVIEND